ncbi:hypothetical protein GCM10027062_08600 [Nocardioides hungaricus]
MRLLVEGAGYRSAAEAFVEGNRQAARAAATLSGELSGYAGMAGDDASAAEFAAAYDPAAADAVGALGEAMAGFGALARLSDASLRNHAQAEQASTLRTPPSRQIPEPAPVTCPILDLDYPDPPSALGGDTTGLPGWGLPGWANAVLDLLESVAWPDADTDRLRAAATTWRTAAVAVGLLAGPCETALAELALEVSPEIPLAVATTRTLRDRLASLADQLSVLAESCEAYAVQVEATRAQMLDVLEDLAWELGIGAVISGGLTFFTGGAAAGPAGAAGAARLAAATTRLRSLLASLTATTRGTATTLRPASTALRDARAYLARLSAARTERGSASFGSFFNRSRREPGWLSRHEIGRRGHTVEKHVGRSRAQLAQRFVDEPGRRLSSSFFDQATAERAIERVLRQRGSVFEEWLQSARYQLLLRGEAGDIVGRILVRDTGELIESSRVRILVIRDTSMPDGWRIKTAYPDLVRGGSHG